MFDRTFPQRVILLLALLSFFFLHFPHYANAAGEFTTSLTNTQTVDERGNTHITKVFSLRNNLSTVYITKYGIELTSTKIQNIRIRDITNNTNLPANIVKNDNTTTIGIEFPDVIVGKDKVRRFSIEYDDPDAAIVSGNVLEVYVPQMKDPDAFDSYQVFLKIPKKFGQPTISNPSTYTLDAEDENNVLAFNQQQSADGISVIFGEKQYFDFSLNYNLQNTTGNRGVMQITLPPDTAYQKVKYSDINPRPEKMETDLDGNWIATYLLEPNQNLTVNAKGIASIYLTPVLDTPINKPQIQHTSSDTFWESTDPIIQNIAQKYQTPHQIFDFTVDTLTYNYDRISTNANRQGAKEALANNENAVCQEFTDVFIAVARANNIPSRQATGYAFTNNSQIRPLSLVKDVLHAWPEYFDEQSQQWIPVDPTWTNTTGGIDYFNHLDFSHFVFAYQGLSSQKPYPAGSYKYEGQEEKDVHINVTDHDIDVEQNLSLEIDQPLSSFLNFFGKQTLLITNNTGVAWYNLPLTLATTENITLNIPQNEVDSLLPYHTVEVPFEAIGQNWFQTQKGELTITVGEHQQRISITASSKLQQLNLDVEYIAYFAASFLFTVLLILFVFRIVHRMRKKTKQQ